MLYTFTGGADGGGPGGIVRDPAGNLYGTTSLGGSAYGLSGFGVAYEIDPSGQETVPHTFTGGADGGGDGVLILDAAGSLYGSGEIGGAATGGVVYKITVQ